MAAAKGWMKQVVNGWAINGVTVLESGQPYSVFDYSGGAASIYWGGGQDLATNPIVPVGGYGATQPNAVLQGTTGVNGNKPVLNANAFGIPTPIHPRHQRGAAVRSEESACAIRTRTATPAGGATFSALPSRIVLTSVYRKTFTINERFALKYDVRGLQHLQSPELRHPEQQCANSTPISQPAIRSGHRAKHLYVSTPRQSGILQHTIGSPRFIQMALHLTF